MPERTSNPSQKAARRSPYQGLLPYTEEDARFFFGREREIKLVIANCFASPVTLLYGSSGVGKSSLLRAGVLYQFRRRDDVLVVVAKSWHDDPVTSFQRLIETELNRIGVSMTPEPASSGTNGLVSGTRRDGSTLAPFTRAVAQALQLGGRDLVVVFDQFEEFFLYQNPATTFPAELAETIHLNALGSLVAVPAPASDSPEATRASASDETVALPPRRSAPQVSFLISLREDALSKLDLFEGRIPGLFDNLIRIDHLDRKSAVEAITRPLEEFNRGLPVDAQISIEEALVAEVIEQVQSGNEFLSEPARGVSPAAFDAPRIETPYLQLVLTRVWDESVRLGLRELRRETLANLGEAARIVRTHLDSVLDEKLTEEERDVAAKVFHYLVTPTGTKVAHSAADLASYVEIPAEKLASVLRKLASGEDRVLRPVRAALERPGDERYEIFHDRLALAILDWRARHLRRQAERAATAKAWQEASVPTSRVVVDQETVDPGGPEHGIALCLAGAGYRAMLFHAGALLRLNEAALLPRLARISTVSAGSIVGGFLGLKWKRLLFENGVARNLQEEFLNPLRELASLTIDAEAIMLGLLLPFGSAAERLAETLDRFLFHKATLQDLPRDEEGPCLVIVATNVQSGALWRFNRAYMGDYRVGRIVSPVVSLATAAAASSALPPILSPFVLKIPPNSLVPDSGSDLRQEPFTTSIHLTDGSVADKLALETAWKRYQTILVSDGGGKLDVEAEPSHDWARHSIRVLELIDHQTRAWQKRQIIDSFQSGAKRGAYWGIWCDIEDYHLPSAFPCRREETNKVASLPTRFKKLEPEAQMKLINWGFIVCDAAIRKHIVPELPPPSGLPYPPHPL